MDWNTLELLNGKLEIVEGEILQIEPEVIWVKQDNGGEMAVAVENASDTFRIGHHIRAVTTDLESNRRLIKAINPETETSVSTISKREAVPSFISAGIRILLGFNFVVLVTVLLPVINLISGLFLTFQALTFIGKVRGALGFICVGLLVFVLVFCLAVFKPLILVALFAPTFGLLVGYGLIGRQAVKDGNELADRVDALLYQHNL